jgi:hypothetical protein
MLLAILSAIPALMLAGPLGLIAPLLFFVIAICLK